MPNQRAQKNPPPLAGTISARMVLRVVEFCRVRGHDAEELCKSAGVSWAAVTDPAGRIPYALAARVGQRALEVTGDENFGLHLAQDVRDPEHFDAGVLLLMASPTVRIALERMEAHQRYWGDGNRAALRRERGGLAVRYDLPGAGGAYARHSDECALAEVALGVRVLSGAPIVPRLVRFRHGAPRSTREHEELFGSPIEFGAEHTEIAFEDAALDTAMQHANAAFFAIFERQVEQALARLPARPRASDGVREAVRAALAGGQCTLAGTARVLGVGARTLQRRLSAEGTSFADVVDALRREMAVAYLEREFPIAEVASLLGYADATAFHHAFRRWTGSSPSRYGTWASAD